MDFDIILREITMSNKQTGKGRLGKEERWLRVTIWRRLTAGGRMWCLGRGSQIRQKEWGTLTPSLPHSVLDAKTPPLVLLTPPESHPLL